jgi:hypothetical protein
MPQEKPEIWVVYQRPMKGSPEGIRAVCEQREWEAMDLAKPGYFTLIQGGISNEGEAERLARGTSGDRPPRNSKRTILNWSEKTAALAVAEATDSPVAT